MKLTWFGGTTMRIHIGGRMLVVDAAGAPDGIDAAELLSGADRVVALGEGLPEIEPGRWQQRRVGALVDEGSELPEVLVHRAGRHAVLVDAVGEPPLLIATGEIGAVGRWGPDAVVVIAGENLTATARSVAALGPRLIAVAGAERAIEAVIAAVGGMLDGTGLMSLEPGLALEV